MWTSSTIMNGSFLSSKIKNGFLMPVIKISIKNFFPEVWKIILQSRVNYLVGETLGRVADNLKLIIYKISHFTYNLATVNGQNYITRRRK